MQLVLGVERNCGSLDDLQLQLPTSYANTTTDTGAAAAAAAVAATTTGSSGLNNVSVTAGCDLLYPHTTDHYPEVRQRHV